MIVLWRDAWLKPVSDGDLGSEQCAHCKVAFKDLDFVTSCEFCGIGAMHDPCADIHIGSTHAKELKEKISLHRDRPLHDFQ